MKGLWIVLAAAVVVAISSQLFLLLDPPYLTKTQLHHYVYGRGMTRLAEALISSEEKFDWIAFGDDRVQAGYSGGVIGGVEISEATRTRLRPLFEEASLYFLLSFENARGGGAGVQLWGGRKADLDYSVHVYFRSEPRENRKPCADGYLNSPLGNCFVRLDPDWIYELGWYSPEYLDERIERERDSERRITSP